MFKNLIILAAFASTLLAPAHASTFGVSPIRIDLAGAVRTSAVVVTNNAKVDLPLKIDAVSWTMSEEGQELYEPTDKLLFFPKELSIPPGESRTIRVGLEPGAAAGQEDTYRLFLRQQPSGPASTATQVAVVVNFGVPVFVRQPGVKPELVVNTTAEVGKLQLTLGNNGSAHARLEKVFFKGSEATVDLGSPYVLRNHKRLFSVPVAEQDCSRGKQQTLVVEHSDKQFEFSVDLTQACP